MTDACPVFFKKNLSQANELSVKNILWFIHSCSFRSELGSLFMSSAEMHIWCSKCNVFFLDTCFKTNILARWMCGYVV